MKTKTRKKDADDDFFEPIETGNSLHLCYVLLSVLNKKWMMLRE